ncbi:MAG: type III secretion system stator protein SctL [Deltaproteobacteria bacterium]|nr:type III secretion system stator protein SctL [Deltaproteobacteria bacterium]
MPSKIVKRKDFEGKLGLEDQVARDEGAAVGFSSAGERRVISRDVYAAVSEAQKIIDEARGEAQRIRREAEALLKRINGEMEKAKKEGFEEGREEGLAQVSELLLEATHAKEKMFEGIERQVIRLVYDISEKIIGRELGEHEKTIVDLIRQALQAAVGKNIVILVNGRDLETVRAHHPQLLQALDTSRTVQIRADEKVAPKGCLIETEIGTIDAQLETQLEAIRKALGIEDGA